MHMIINPCYYINVDVCPKRHYSGNTDTLKPPPPTNIVDDVNTPIYYINNMDIDDIERFSLYILEDIAKCATIPCGNIPLSVFLGLKI